MDQLKQDNASLNQKLIEMEKNPDDAHRVLYVGVTRAKKNLILKMPEDPQRGWAV